MEIARFDLGEYLRRQLTEDCIKTNSEKLSELKVRVYGDTAVATYKDTSAPFILVSRFRGKSQVAQIDSGPDSSRVGSEDFCIAKILR